MSLKTQGTELFVLDETTSPSVVVQIGCPTSYSPGGSTRDQIETTCLGDDERTYVSGLSTPSQETFDIIFDADDDSHRLLEALQESGENVEWYAGLSDGTTDPTVVAGHIVAATSRTGFTFTANVAGVSYSIPVNDVIRATVTLQRSGARVWTYKNP